MQLALKLDVDTYRGYREGVPRLLDAMAARGIKISAFFSFGPDNSGKAIRRIFRKGFIAKMLRTRAPSTYGIKTMLYGTILPAPMIVESAPEIFARAVRDGHDCGVHAWDHVYVQDELESISREQFAEQFRKAAEMFESISGERPMSYAAPGWQTTRESREVLDGLGLEYTSCTRGTSPYHPSDGRDACGTVELPTTLPTMDEIYGEDGADDSTIPGIWADALADDHLNVLTIHAEMEGMSKLGVLERFLDLADDRGAAYTTLREAAHEHADAPACAVKAGYVKGRAGTLSIQGDEIA